MASSRQDPKKKRKKKKAGGVAQLVESLLFKCGGEKNLTTELSHDPEDPAIPLLCTYPKDLEAGTTRYT
jgi:hypothetical protein